MEDVTIIFEDVDGKSYFYEDRVDFPEPLETEKYELEVGDIKDIEGIDISDLLSITKIYVYFFYGAEGEKITHALDVADGEEEIGEIENPYSILINSDSLISWWRMDEMEGNNILDDMGNNPGTAYGDTYIFNDPQRGNVASFDGSGDYIQTSYINFDYTSEFTISAWIKENQGNLWQSFVEASDSAHYPYLIADRGLLDGRGSFYWKTSGGSYMYKNYIFPEQLGVDPIGWTHIIVQNDGAQFVIYTNGNYNSAWIHFNNFYNTVPDTIYISGNSGGRNVNGFIDEVMIFNKALSAEEIQTIYDTQNV